ncbi:MAG: hypothetical protein LBR39_06670 [Coriobacteriales bacterium]|nr:hypothetical protein [Coriobacteriales bacterium]
MAMGTLLLLQLKAQRQLLPLLALVVALMLLMGVTGAQALGGRAPAMSLAVQEQAADDNSAAFIERLQATPNLEVLVVEPALSANAVFERYQVQALVVIPTDFSERIAAGGRLNLEFYPAPGITDSSFAQEQVADAAMRLRAYRELELALAEYGEQAPPLAEAQPLDLLDVVYEGPGWQAGAQTDVETGAETGATAGTQDGAQAGAQTAEPVFSVAALLLLLAWLHSALTVPTAQSRRLRVHGRWAYIRQLLASLAAVLLAWLLILACYLLVMTLALQATITWTIILGLMAIIAYSALLAALLAQLLGRTVTTWLFLPFFVLNMTLGGGLYNDAVLTPAVSPLVPVVVAASGGLSQVGTIMLIVGAVSAIIISIMYSYFRMGRENV